MQACPQCQTLNALDALFCSHCGAGLATQSPTGVQPGVPAATDPANPTGSGYAPPAYPYGAPPSAPPSASPYAPPLSAPLPGTPYPPGYGARPTAPIAPGGVGGYSGYPSAPYQNPPSYAPGELNPATGAYPAYPSMGGSMGRPASQSQTLTTVFGDDVEPVAAQPSTRLQQSLMRNVSPRYAVNRWFMAALGALIAAGIGLLLTFLMQSWISSTISNIIDAAAGASSAGQLIGGVVKTVITPDTLKLFAVEHRIPLDVTVAGSGLASVSGDMTVSTPITGLLLIPAIGLLIGGYVSGASDFRRTGRFSMARGALVGPFYGVILAILALFSSSSSSAQFLDISASASISPVAWQAFLYGLLWGVIFGGLGGWIQFAGGGFLGQAIPTLRARYGQTLRGARAIGAISGALVAVVSGLLTSMALLIALVAFGVVDLAQVPGESVSPLPLGGANLGAAAPGASGSAAATSGVAQLIVFLALLLTPTFAAYLFTLAAGASFQISSTSLLSSGNSNASWGLFSGQHILPPNAPQWLYLIALIPAICFFAGGRVAARAAGARTGGDGLVAGALMAVPASILMALLAYLSGWGIDIAIGGQSAVSTSAAPGAGSVFLTTLIVGGALGGIGGMTVAGVPSASGALRALMFPFLPLAGWMSNRLDAFTRYPSGLQRSTGRQRLYDAVLAAFGIGIIAVALDICNLAIAAVVPFKQLITADAIVAGLLVIIPSLLLVSALATAFGSSPLAVNVPWSPGFVAPLPASHFGVWPGVGTAGPGSQGGAAPVTYAAPPSAPVTYAAPPSAPVGYAAPPSAPASYASPVSAPASYAAPPSAPVAPPLTETAPHLSAFAGAPPDAGSDSPWRPSLSDVAPSGPPEETPPSIFGEPDAH